MKVTRNPETPTKGVTRRAVILSILIIPFNAYFLINNHVYLSGLPTTISLFYNVIIILSALTILNLGIKQICPDWALHQGELLTIYVMLAVASAMAGHDMLQTVIPALTHGFWYATPENDWQNLFWRYLPSGLVMSELQQLPSYYYGESSLYLEGRIWLWVKPTIWWTTFFTALVMVMACINLFVRERWTLEERLTYPIIFLPAEMTQPSGNLFISKLLWAGFALSASLALFNGVHYLIPNFPEIPNRKHEIGALFTQKPFNAIGFTPIYVLPFAVGLSFFMPLSLSFSVWFFYWLWKGIRIMGVASGFHSLPRFPYAGEQTTGAYLAITGFVLWDARRHFSSIFHSLFRRKNGEASREYGWAFTGMLLGTTFLVFWMQRAGMSFGVCLLYLGLYLIIGVSITRLRAEVGPPTHEMYESTPHRLLVMTMGTRRLGAGNLTVMGLLWGFNRGYRAHPMPHILEALKLSDVGHLHRGRLVGAMIIATVIGTIASYWAFIDMSYRDGAINNPPWGGFIQLQNWLYYAKPSDWISIGFLGIGATIASFLRFMRFRFLWWTLHPAGFALTGSTWTVGWLWFSIFISWLVKSILLKGGGIGAYRRAVPLFLGLLLGDYLVGGGWIIVRLIFRVDTYVFWR